MNRNLLLAGLVLVLSLLSYSAVSAEGQQSNPPKEWTAIPDRNLIMLKVPFQDERFSSFPIAVVNDKPIAISAFSKALSSSGGEKAARTGKDLAAQLDRMITLELILLEARSIGLDELKDVQARVESYSRDLLLELLQKGKVKDVKVDEAEVAKVYQGMVREYLTESALFDKEDDARKMIAGLAEGKSFGELADQASADGSAKIERSSTYLKDRNMIPEIRKEIAGMKVGTVSPPITITTDKGKGFVVLRLIEIRDPEDPAAREQARQTVLKQQQRKAIEKYNTELYKKYLTIDYKLLDKLDFDAKSPSFEKMLQDKRVLVRIKGGKPVTVGDLADALKGKFFHGVEEAIGRKKLNKEKFSVLRDVVGRRLFRLVALNEGIDKSEEYKEAMNNFEESLLIGKFVEKVIAPEIKTDEQMLRDYYAKHISEFTYPEMVRLESLAFKTRTDAETALDSLNKGAEFTWIKQNADALVPPETEGILSFGGKPIMTSELSEDIRKLIGGGHAGDSRLYPGPGGYFYVLSLGEVIPATARPYEEVRGQVAEKVARELIGKGIEDWGKKLREVYPVTIYASFDD